MDHWFDEMDEPRHELQKSRNLPVLDTGIPGRTFWSSVSRHEAGMADMRGMDRTMLVDCFTAAASTLPTRITAANTLLRTYQLTEEELFSAKQEAYGHLSTLFRQLSTSSATGRPAELMEAMKVHPVLLLLFTKVADRILFQLFLSYVMYPTPIVTRTFKQWWCQLETCQNDVVKLHKSWKERIKQQYNNLGQLLDHKQWTDKQIKCIKTEVIDEVKFCIIQATNISPADRERSMKKIRVTLQNKVEDLQKIAFLHYLLMHSQGQGTARCKDFLLELLMEWSKTKKKKAVILSCAELFVELCEQSGHGHRISPELCADDRAEEILSPLLFSSDVTLSIQVAQLILEADQSGTFTNESHRKLVKYTKKHIENLLTTVGTTLEMASDENEEGDVGRQGTVIFKGRHYRKHRPPSFVNCTASLPASITDFERFREGKRHRVQDTIDRMKELRRDGRPGSLVDVSAYAEYGSSGSCFYVLEYESEQPTTLWDVADDSTHDVERLIRAILHAVHFAHSCGVVLRSLSPGSFLYVRDDSGQKSAVFHDIQHMRGENKYFGEFFEMLWSAPESLLDFTYSAKSDVYSVGKLMLFVLNGGVHPDCRSKRTDALTILRQNLHGHFLPPLHPRVSLELYLLGLKCLYISMAKRPAVQDLCRSVEELFGDVRPQMRHRLSWLTTSRDTDKCMPSHDTLSSLYCYPLPAGTMCTANVGKSQDEPEVFGNVVKLPIETRQTIDRLDHPNLVHTIDRMVGNQIVLRLDIGQHWGLDEYARSKQPGYRNREYIYDQLLGAVSYLHSRKLVLAVLAPHYVRVNADMKVMLVHLSRLVTQGEEDAHFTSPVRHPPTLCETTARWSPWETNEFGYVSQASDVAMLGYTMWQVENIVAMASRNATVDMKRTVPFPDVKDSEVSHVQAEGYVLTQAECTPSFLHQLIEQMVQLPVICRPTVYHVRSSVLQSRVSVAFDTTPCGQLLRDVHTNLEQDACIPTNPGLTQLVYKLQKDTKPVELRKSKLHFLRQINKPATTSRESDPQSTFFVQSPLKDRTKSVHDQPPQLPGEGNSGDNDLLGDYLTVNVVRNLTETQYQVPE